MIALQTIMRVLKHEISVDNSGTKEAMSSSLNLSLTRLSCRPSEYPARCQPCPWNSSVEGCSAASQSGKEEQGKSTTSIEITYFHVIGGKAVASYAF